MASYLAAQPLAFNDFSGGLTDNILQGDPHRYAAATNFLITVDKKLETRHGTTMYDPSANIIGTSNARVASLFTGISESVLFAHSNRDLYTQVPDSSYGNPFVRVLGPTGNEAISNSTNYSQLSYGEFQRQNYFTTDAGALPGKIFKDQTNTWKALTAGVPKMAFTPNYPTTGNLIAASVMLANAIRASMISHFNDQANITFGTDPAYQHKFLDKYSLAYLQTVVFNVLDPEYPGPSPYPTPAPAATNEATLYTLCAALAQAYEHHRNDLSGPFPDDKEGGPGLRKYHQDITVQPAPAGPGTTPSGLGISAKLTLSGTVVTAAKAASFLDDLAQKWYWHQLAPFSHSLTNDYSVMSRYLVATPKIGTRYTSALTLQVTPDNSNYIAFAWWCKQVWNKHASGNDSTFGGMHTQVDSYGPITLPDPTDADSAALTIFWARWMYGQIHVYDSNYPAHTNTTFTPDGIGLFTISGVGFGTLPVGNWLIADSDIFDDPNPFNRRSARVLASGAGTATLSRALLTGAAQNGQFSGSWVHGSYLFGTFLNNASLSAPSTAFLVNQAATGTDLNTWITLGSEFMTAMAVHQNDGTSHRQQNYLGNELFDIAPANGNQFFFPVVSSYVYAAFYRYQYTVEPNGLLYLTEGAPVFSSDIQTTASYPVGTVIKSPNTTYFGDIIIKNQSGVATVANIPSLINTSVTNYDTTISVAPQPEDSTLPAYYENLTIELYRTISGGTTFYFVDQLVNNTAVTSQNYIDTTNENFPTPGTTALGLRKTMYTSGGVVANDAPPVCKYIHAVNGFMYYGAITDAGQFFPQRIRQSIQGAPDAAPASFFDDLEDELTGLSSTRNNLIALCKNSVYRIAGSFTSTGQGAMSHERISDTMGALNSKSIVRTEVGVFFAGNDGFYYTDGYQLIKISLDLDATYRKHTTSENQKSRIHGCYDKLTRRVWWSMQSQDTAADNDVFFVFYLDYGIKPSGVFTKASTTRSWNPASAVFYKGALVIGDTRGYLFKTDPYTKTDLVVDTTQAPSAWRTCYIPWDFRTCALDFGTTFMRKWITKIHSVGQNVGNGAIQINSINDNNALPGNGIKPLPPIQYLGNAVWGDARVVWGTSSYAWKYDGKMDVWRRFPAGSMRSDFKQVQYVPGDFVVYKSDDFPQFAFATVFGSTATLQTPSGYVSLLWPLDVVDYYISFSTDAYAVKYLVTALDVTKKIITFTGTAPSNTMASWQISGIKKEQRIRITAFDVHFSTLGDKDEAYPGKSQPGGQGANA